MKTKKLVIKTTYFGSIRKCISLNKENNYSYINSELVSENRLLLETNKGKFITGSEYVNKKNNLLSTTSNREGEIYIDKNSLVPANDSIGEKINKKSLHL